MKRQLSQWFLLVVAVALLGLVLSYTVGAQDLNDSGQPAPSPLAPPEPISQSAARAVQYLAAREAIPVEDVVVLAEAPMAFPSLGLEYQHILLETVHGGLQRTFVLLVDPQTGNIEPSLPQVRAAEEAAHRAKYGALDPLLYERLQAAQEKDLFAVAIWAAANEQARQPEELFAEVARLFPEAEVALQSHGAPWVVDDPALAARIRSEYARLLDASVALQTEPIVRWLTEQGIAAERATSIPVVSATLTKAQLLEASRNPMVGRIFADDNVAGPASPTQVG